MVQGYYSLQEAAQFLDMNTEELKQMAQKKEIRSFQDRGTLRFRVQDVQELGRRRGTTSSDPDLVIGESSLPPTPKVAPKSPVSPRTPHKQESPAVKDEVFDFSLDVDDAVGIGKEILADIPSGARKSGPKGTSPSPNRKSGHRSPQPHSGSTSDIKLVSESRQEGSDSDVRLIGQDSDVKIADSGSKTPKVARKPVPGSPSPTPSKSSRLGSAQPDSSPKKHSSRLGGASQPADSGVRLVPLDSDSDVKIVGAGSDEVSLGASPPPSASDSDIRLEKYAAQLPPDSGEGSMHLTEEINLDEEIRKQEAALQQPQGKLKPKSKAKFPTTSPFELSDSGDSHDSLSASGTQKLSMPDSSDFDLAPAKSQDDSSDFNLSSPADSSSGSVLLQPDSDDFSLELPDDSALGSEPSNLSGPSSGISLNNPVDAGISLEEGNPEASDMDFDLSLEVEATPKPASARGPEDSDSEFELSMDADDSGPQAVASSPMESDSEFELTLDDSGSHASDDQKGDSVEKDIFETDFEVPALEDDSGSHVAALDTELDSSDFDIALDESAVDEDSASQVAALDEDAEGAAVEGAEAEEFGELAIGDEEGEEVVEAAEDVDDAKTVVKHKMIQPAPWGPLPVAFMLPCVIVMVLVGLLGFELVQSAGGYKAPGFLTKAIGDMIGQKIK